MKLNQNFNTNLKYTSSTLQVYLKCTFYFKYTSTVLHKYTYTCEKPWPRFQVYLFQWTTLWIEFNCQAAESQRGLTFNHQVTRNPWYLLGWTLKDEKLRQFFSPLILLNLGSLVWWIYTLITRPLLHKLCKLTLVFCPAEIELYLKYISVL